MPPDFLLSPKQHKALSSLADITIMGGGNFGGKSFAARMLPLLPEYLMTPGCQTVLFAESNRKLEMAGGMADACKTMYMPLHPKGRGGYKQTPEKRWTWPSGSTISLSYVGEPGQWDAMEAPVIVIDQAEQITWSQFDSVSGRNRSATGVRCRIFLTVNPPEEGRDHWITKLLESGGWIDLKTGDAIPEVDGKVRYFVIIQDEFVFADGIDELRQNGLLIKDRDGKEILPKSLTFVQALVDDHPIKEAAEREKRTLASKGEIERARRLYGNWHATESAGKYFQREWFPVIEYKASYQARRVRTWDNAWSESDGADWTPGILMSQEADNFLTIQDMLRFRGSPFHVARAIRLVAELDGPEIEIRLPFDAGRAGFDQTALARWLRARGYRVHLTQDKGDKLTRSKPYQERCEGREVRLATSHLSAGIAEQLLQPFMAYQDDGTEIQIDGLHEINVSTLDGWRTPFLNDHVRFGRDTLHKRSIKKDAVDAAVGGNDVLTSQIGRDPVDDDAKEIQRHAAALRAITTPAPRQVGALTGRVSPRFAR